MNKNKNILLLLLLAFVVGMSFSVTVSASGNGKPNCAGLPSHSELTSALKSVVAPLDNGGLGNDMWGTVVNRDGVVCSVFRTGNDRGDQWPGSR
ncbi:MAG: heme-binding protein, partial [Gammaproteobacteria bacterium]